MPVFTAQDYTANANENGITFTPKKGHPLTVPYGALETVKWEPNTKKTKKGKTPFTKVDFVYRNKEQNTLPKPLRIGNSHADATKENIGAIDYIRNQIMNSAPLPEWKQDTDPEELKKANKKRAIKICIGLVAAIVFITLCFNSCGSDNNTGSDNNSASPTASTTQEAQDPVRMKYDVWEICQKKTKELLALPASAEFPSIVDDTDVIAHTDESGKIVRLTHDSYVDAQNILGAKVRINYSCEAEVTETPGVYSVRAELEP